MVMPIATAALGGGEPRHCPVCRQVSWVEPSITAGDAPCSSCGHLLWPDDQVLAPFVNVGPGGRVVARPAARVVIRTARTVARRVLSAVGRVARPRRLPVRPAVAGAKPSGGVWDPWLDG